MEWVVAYAIAVILIGVLGSYVAGAKGRSGSEGFFLGLLLGPIGLIIVALLPTVTPPKQPVARPVPRYAGGSVECPYCHTVTPVGTRNCPTVGCGGYLLDLPVTGAIPIASEEPELLRREADGRLVRPCPACAELILAEATLCRFCHTPVSAAEVTS
jgi:hypothetical protein